MTNKWTNEKEKQITRELSCFGWIYLVERSWNDKPTDRSISVWWRCVVMEERFFFAVVVTKWYVILWTAQQCNKRTRTRTHPQIFFCFQINIINTNRFGLQWSIFMSVRTSVRTYAVPGPCIGCWQEKKTIWTNERARERERENVNASVATMRYGSTVCSAHIYRWPNDKRLCVPCILTQIG